VISNAAILGVLMAVAGMAFFAFGGADGKGWNWLAFGALAMLLFGLALTVYFGAVG